MPRGRSIRYSSKAFSVGCLFPTLATSCLGFSAQTVPTRLGRGQLAGFFLRLNLSYALPSGPTPYQATPLSLGQSAF